jgi:7-cyano-7-deazaguanine synthase in queuosine biosynthesis
MENKLTVDQIRTTGNRLNVKFVCEGQIKKFFEANSFFVEYNTSIEHVPEEILVIPFLSIVMPIAWAGDAEVNVEKVDSAFLESLGVVKKSLQSFYPKLRLKGSLNAEAVAKPHAEGQRGKMMLFSGGVDSLATYIRHRNEDLTLLHVYTADITQQKKANKDVDIAYIKDFCDRSGLPLRTVSSNFMDVIDRLMLSRYDKYIGEESNNNWWGRIMHGLALIGLCAPIAYAEKIGKLYIASSYTAEFSGGWGSHPDIDNNIKWTGMKVVHDGYELSRQDKMNLISDYAKTVATDFKLQCCFDLTNDNCNRCEKCSRTILGLELAGFDPNKCGFRIEDNTFSSIKDKLAKGTWFFGDDQRFMWGDIKKHAYQKNRIVHPEARALIEWLSKTDINSLPSTTNKTKFDLKAYMRPLFDRSPYMLYRVIRKFYFFCLIVFPFVK